MPQAIIIAFQYKDDKHLCSIQYDIHRILYMCRKYKFDVVIITDIIIFEKEIIDKLKEISKYSFDEELDLPLPSIHHVQNSNDLYEYISLYNNPKDGKIFLYYTGHGEKDIIILPDNTNINPRMILNILIENDNQIIILFDCCYPSSLSLAYKLNNYKLTLRKGDFIPIKNEVLLITGANEDKNEKAMTNKYGSIFTVSFFNLILYNLQLRDLTDISHKLINSIYEERNGYIQTVSIYTSKCIPRILWSWFDFPDKLNIVFDTKKNCFLIKGYNGDYYI